METNFAASRNFSFVDKEATAKLAELNRQMANPVYIVQDEISNGVLENCDRFIETLQSIKNSELSPSEIMNFYEQYPETADLQENPEDLDMLLNLLRQTLEEVQRTGLFSLEDTHTASRMAEIVFLETNPGKRILMSREELPHLDNLALRLQNMDTLKNLNPGYREFISAFVIYFAEVNAFISRALTEENQRTALDNTKEVIISIDAGDNLLKAGTVITNQQARIIHAMRQQRFLSLNDWIKPFLFMAMVLLPGFFSANGLGIQLIDWKKIWIYTTLAGTYLVVAALVSKFTVFPAYLNAGLVLPTALTVILINQLLRSRRLAGLSAALMSLVVYFLTKGDMSSFLFTLFSGIGSIMSYRRYESGLELLRTGLRLSGIMAAISLLTGYYLDMPINSVALMTLIAAGNGLATGVLSLAVLPLLGLALNIATTFRLAELSDSNTPILRKMRIQAPGTFIHSQNVAQLAEAACDAIGADGLLARVGSYYHDIGKIDQPQYFIENQTGENRHDEMPAGLSAAAIRSHVKIGMEKGREIRLPQEILDIIEQHHGTCLIQYFYIRAMQKNAADNIPEGGFTYDGPIPQSKETAVVMLADGCEAAARTIKAPTPAKLEKCIRNIILDRFKTGELNDSELTPKDLQTIQSTFTSILRGHYHLRISYPEVNGNSE